MSTNVQSIGLTLQRKSHLLEDKKSPYEVWRPPYRRRRWQLGMAMFIVANLIGSTIQITTLPLPVLSTLQASGLVFNSICASFILGEPFTRWSLGGTLLVTSGAVLIAIFGAIPEPAHSLDQLLFLLARRTFIIWIICQTILVAGIIALTSLLSHTSILASNPQILLFRGLACGVISGILSAHSLLLAKSAVELLLRTILDRINQFIRWQSWATVLGLVFLALTQLYYLHRGLKLVSTSVLYPLVFCIYNITAILDGLIYFKQTDRLSPLRACLVILGTIILLSGVLTLSWRLPDTKSQRRFTKSALAPGMGFIEDIDTENEDYSDSMDVDEDESMNTERQPLLSSTSICQRSQTSSTCRAAYSAQNLSLVNNRDETWNPLKHIKQLTFGLISSKSRKRMLILPAYSIMEVNVQTEPIGLARKRTMRPTRFLGFGIPLTNATKRIVKNRVLGEFLKMRWLGFKSDRYNKPLHNR